MGVHSSNLSYLLDQSRVEEPLYACCGTFLFLLDLASGGLDGNSYCSPAVWPENLDRAPTHCLGAGEITKNALISSFSPGLFSELPERSHGSPTSQPSLFSFSFSLILFGVCVCAVSVHLALKRNCSKYRWTFIMFLGGISSVFSYVAILDTSACATLKLLPDMWFV